MEWVALGNNAFISAHYFPKEFMDSLKIRTDIKYMFNFQKIKGKDSGKELNFTNPMLKSKQDYKYFRALVYSVVTRFDTASTTVLGRYKDGDPNFISIKFGDGMFYINTASYMFTNYNMVIGKNYEYAEKALSYLDRNYFTAWDKSNSMQMEQPTTPFRFILLNTPLRWAFYTALFAVIMFILFRAKRQQRIIPVIKPLKNSTLEFAGTIGNLYLHKPDHHAMAEKKIRHFLELVRNKYHLQTNELDDNFTRKLSLKSGCDAGLIKSIILDINAVRVVSAISDETLVRLNKNIDNFYIRSNHGKYE